MEDKHVCAYHEQDSSKDTLTPCNEMQSRVEHNAEARNCANPHEQRHDEIPGPITARYKIDEDSEYLA